MKEWLAGGMVGWEGSVERGNEGCPRGEVGGGSVVRCQSECHCCFFCCCC